MKQNTFLTVAIALLIFVCGYVLGYLSSDTADTAITTITDQVKETATQMEDIVKTDEPIPTVENGEAVAFTINVENIPETQRAFLTTMGISGNEIVVTNAMLACAEAEIGVARMLEIKNGATPAMTEGLKLAGCY